MNQFKVGEEVMYGGHKAKVFGVAERKDFGGDKYAISFTDDDGDFVNVIVSKPSLSKIKSEDELEKGDKVKHPGLYGDLEIKARHEDSDGTIFYFAVDKNNDCCLFSSDHIEEVL